MKDYFFKFANEAEMNTQFSSLFQQDYVTQEDEDGNQTKVASGDPYLVKETFNYAIDILGTLYEETGNTLTDSDGGSYPETSALTGWHVNVRVIGGAYTELFDEINETYGITPDNPQRVFA